MSRFCRIIVIFSLVAVLLGFPHTAIADPLETLIPPATTATTQANEADFFKRGTYKVMAGDYQGAIADLTSAIQLNPKNADAYTNQGLARAGIGDRHGAIADFTSAIQLNPSLSLAYYNRGFVRSQLQDYQGAIEDLSRAIELNPEDADSYHCRCLVHYTLGDKKKVIEDFQKAAALYLKQEKPEEYEALVNGIKKLRSPTHLAVY